MMAGADEEDYVFFVVLVLESQLNRFKAFGRSFEIVAYIRPSPGCSDAAIERERQ